MFVKANDGLSHVVTLLFYHLANLTSLLF